MNLADRFPLMPKSAEPRLLWLEEHPHAPRFTHPGVDRVTAAGLAAAQAYAVAIDSTPPRWAPGAPPAWVGPFIEYCCHTTPFYRRYGDPPARLADAPTCDRGDLARQPWSFVPDDQPLDDLIVYNTSGTTGHPLAIPTHPDTLARYIPLLKAALATHGIVLAGAAARPAAILQVCWQRRTYTMAGLLAALDWAGFVKINLNPAEWRRPNDAAAFVDACAPEVITGDPLSFAELARLPVTARPAALVSTALALAAGLRQELEARFGCPVLDMYSLNESGPVAVSVASEDVRSDDFSRRGRHEATEVATTGVVFKLFQPQLYVEILTADGSPCPPGVTGEIVLTGGFNPRLPLLRYRTGDTAALIYRGAEPLLTGLNGRPPVVFVGSDGRRVNNVDISNALRPYSIPWHALHQAADGRLTLRVAGSTVGEETLRAAVAELFGSDQPLTVSMEDARPPAEKVVQYTSDRR